MKKKNLENIGKVAINEVCLSDTEIGLYIPIEEMSGSIRKQYKICEKCFSEAINKAYPDINISDYTVYSDITLNLNINNGDLNYTVSIILWIEDEEGHEIHSDVCKKILRDLQRSIKEIARLFLHDVTRYNYWIEEIQEDIEYIEDIQSDIDGEAQDTVNYRLAEFYDFCDDLRIWLPV